MISGCIAFPAKLDLDRVTPVNDVDPEKDPMMTGQIVQFKCTNPYHTMRGDKELTCQHLSVFHPVDPPTCVSGKIFNCLKINRFKFLTKPLQIYCTSPTLKLQCKFEPN